MEAKKIIITGAATRIGSAIAKSLVNFQTKIGIHFNRSKSNALKLKRELEDKNFKTTLNLIQTYKSLSIAKGMRLEPNNPIFLLKGKK